MSDVLVYAMERNPDLAKIQDKDGNTILHISAEEGLVEVLVKASEIDAELAKIKNKDGKTFVELCEDMREIYGSDYFNPVFKKNEPTKNEGRDKALTESSDLKK